MERKFTSAGGDFTKALVFKLGPISRSPGGLASSRGSDFIGLRGF